MTTAQKLLITAGLVLAILGMSYGLYYALFDEHQTLEGMGISMATGFAQAARGKIPEAQAAIKQYGNLRYEYVREVHAHSHWISLGMVLIVLGLAFQRIAFEERIRLFIALSLVSGAFLFPLGVIMQTLLAPVPAKIIAIAGTITLVGGLAVASLGLLLPEKQIGN